MELTYDIVDYGDFDKYVEDPTFTPETEGIYKLEEDDNMPTTVSVTSHNGNLVLIVNDCS